MPGRVLAEWNRWRDVALALAMCAMGQYELWSGSTYDGAAVWPGGSRAFYTVLIVALTVPLAWRRRWPDAVCGFVFALLAVSCAVLGGGEATTEFVLFVVTAFTATAYARWPTAQAAAALVAGTIHELRDPHVHGFSDAVWSLGMLVIAWLLGWAVRTRQQRIGALESAARVAERLHAEQVAAATAAERAEIARELHDIVAHAVAVIVIQAQAGERALPRDTALAAEVLETIETSARSALVELRRLLTLLTDGSESALEPLASLTRLPDLIATFRAAGLDVAYDAPNALPTLPPTADLTAYRIVQQALTNTLQHAQAARVALRRDAGRLDILVEDHRTTGSTPPEHHGAGRGLIGMRERLALVGGELLEAARTDDGFRVHATIPLEPTEEPTVDLTEYHAVDLAAEPAEERAAEPVEDRAEEQAATPETVR
ncbi:MAG: hypothetical protein BGO26_18540 [Actinobacteria bacterium 69-20]|jgi:signal transduction histidine kinase|nr:hypothetical protein [Actinomycetota bacterium]OJV24575.1 MAG: hypothetical protein BGO26_18540 [Actinobacteria bacterium 69-20]